MIPIVVTSGEPAGIGPDISLSLPSSDVPVVLLADMDMLKTRRELLQKSVDLVPYEGQSVEKMDRRKLYVLHRPVREKVNPGILNPSNSSYVIRLIKDAVFLCQQGKMSAMVTAPVNKAVINDAGITFSGHTEYLADLCSTKQAVMMLACDKMRVALATTHLPLAKIPKILTQSLLEDVIKIVNKAMSTYFSVRSPHIIVAGLNPHAGENGYLGREDIEIIKPVISKLSSIGLHLSGPIPADTLFCTPEFSNADVYLTMYHDQGLPVVKYAGFHQTANVTLGLPIIRTSVDHGTALSLAGTGSASAESLIYATRYAWRLAQVHQRSVL